MNRLVAGIGVVALLSSCTGDKALCAADEEMNPYTGECEPERSSGGSAGDGSSDGGGEPDGEDSGGSGDDTGAAGDGRGALPEGAAYATVGLGRELWPEEDGKLDCDEVELSLADEEGLLLAWGADGSMLGLAVHAAGDRTCDVDVDTTAVALAYLASGGMMASPERSLAMRAALSGPDRSVVTGALADGGDVVELLDGPDGDTVRAGIRDVMVEALSGTGGPPPPPGASLAGGFSFVDYELVGVVEDSSDTISFSASLTDDAPAEFVLFTLEGDPALWLVPDGVPRSMASALMALWMGSTPSLYAADGDGTATLYLTELTGETSPELDLMAVRMDLPRDTEAWSVQKYAAGAQLAAIFETLITFGFASVDVDIFGAAGCTEAIASDLSYELLLLGETLASGGFASQYEITYEVLLTFGSLVEDALAGSGPDDASWIRACDLDLERLAKIGKLVGRVVLGIEAVLLGLDLGDLTQPLLGAPGVERATHSICPFADCDAGECGWRGDDLVCSDELFCTGDFSDVAVDGTVVSFTGSVTCDVAIDTLTVKLGDTATLWTTAPGTTSVSFSQAVDTASADVTGDTQLGLWARPSGAEAERVATADIHIDGACSDSGARTCISGDVWRVDDCGDVVGSSADDTCLSTEECLESGDTAWCSPVDTGCDDSGATTCISGDVWRVDDCGDVVGSRADDTCTSTEECVDYGTYAECVTVEEPGEPNLDPGTLSLSPDSGHAGRITMAYVDLTNEGDADAGTVEYGFYWSSDTSFSSGDEELYTGSTSLDAGETVSLDRGITIPDDADEGRGYVLLVADPDDRIDESSESDNVAWDAFDVEAPEDDAEAWSVTITESTADPGDDISIFTKVYNRGTEEITFTWAIYWSDNSTWSTADTLLYEETSTIPAGRSDSYIDTVTVPTGADDGTGYVFLVADPDDELAESDEDNNEAKDSITIR